MDYLDHFGIPIHGIQKGIHEYHFDIDDPFFDCFEASPIRHGKYRVKLECDKRDNEFILRFEINGQFSGDCDRCLADIEVPSSISKMVWVKFSGHAEPEAQDEDVIFVDGALHIFNVAELIHEFILLSMPLVLRYDCENDPNPRCDRKVLAYLESQEASLNESEGQSLADAMKKLKDL